MSEGKTLLGILVTVMFVFFMITSIVATSASQKCGTLQPEISPNIFDQLAFLGTTLSMLLFDPCMSASTWFLWIFTIPLVATAILVIKKLALI